MMRVFLFFFFQAEDGIRDTSVTGVQTCALPIYRERRVRVRERGGLGPDLHPGHDVRPLDVERIALETEGEPEIVDQLQRSEERRVGKECRYRGSAYH